MAFVVAVASTVVFYGLFVGKLKSAPPQRNVVVAAKALRPGAVIAASDVKSMAWSGSEVPKGMFEKPDQVIGHAVVQPVDEGEPVLESRLITQSGGGFAVPSGMRAVSVHVSDSSGVLAMLKPGYKVDVQAFATRQGERGPESEARTAFQNVTVLALSMQAEPSALGGFNAPVVTLLVTPREADALGIADSFGRVRLALRNPVDEGRENKPALASTAVFRGSWASASASSPSTAAERGVSAENHGGTRAGRSQVAFSVQLLSASQEAVREFAQHGLRGKQDIFGASEVPNARELDAVLAALRDRKAVDVLSTSRLNAAMSRSAAVELNARGESKPEDGSGLRVQFSPFVTNGQVHLRVQPEVTAAGGPSSVKSRKLETEIDISGGHSFFITGIADPRGDPAAAGRQLLVLVTPSLL